MILKLASRFVLMALFLFTTCFAYAEAPEGCKEYAKYGLPSETGNILCRTGYLLSHDPDRKTPAWVAEHLTSEKASAVLPRSNDFQPDPDLEEGHRAELSDYKKSGYDRGHMAPAGDMRWAPQAMRESFFLSNMIPQIGPGMNQGIWKDLEEKVRLWAIDREELYIYTGPIYADAAPKTIGENKVAVPTHIFKVVFDPIRVEAIAFIMPNVKLKFSDMPNYIVSIRDVEKQTGLDFLSALQKRVQDLVETDKAPGLWQ